MVLGGLGTHGLPHPTCTHCTACKVVLGGGGQCGKQNLPCSGTVCAGAGVAPLLAWSRPLACPHVPEQASGLPGVHVPEQASGLPDMHVPEQAFGLPGQPGMHVPGQALGLLGMRVPG